MKASLLSKRAIAGVLGGAALVGVAVTGANAASSPASPPLASPAGHSQPVRVNVPAAITPNAVGWSARACWGNVQGIHNLPFNAPVSAGQPVVVSATELDPNGNVEFIGQATVNVDSVAVTNGIVQTVVNANWGSPITICLHYIA